MREVHSHAGAKPHVRTHTGGSKSG